MSAHAAASILRSRVHRGSDEGENEDAIGSESSTRGKLFARMNNWFCKICCQLSSDVVKICIIYEPTHLALGGPVLRCTACAVCKGCETALFFWQVSFQSHLMPETINYEVVQRPALSLRGTGGSIVSWWVQNGAPLDSAEQGGASTTLRLQRAKKRDAGIRRPATQYCIYLVCNSRPLQQCTALKTTNARR